MTLVNWFTIQITALLSQKYNNDSRAVFLIIKHKMKYIILIFLCCTCVFSKAQLKKEIIVINRDNNHVNLYYMSNLFYGTQIGVDSMNTVTIYTNDTIYLINTNGQQLVKVTGGDTVWVAGEQLLTNNFTALNSFFRDLYVLHGTIRNITRYIGSVSNLPKYNRLIAAMQQKRTAFLQGYTDKLSATDKIAIRSMIDCAAIVERLKLDGKNFTQKTLPSYYKDSLTIWARRISTLQYQGRHLLLYEAALKVFQTQTALNKKDGIAIALRLFTGPVQQFLYARVIKDSMADFSRRYTNVQQLLRSRQWSLTDTALIGSLEEEMRYVQQAATRPSKGIALMDAAGQVLDLQQVLQQHRGKLVYVDCWASWCVPCLAEMPASRRLQQQYAGKPVVFLYISMDKNKADWLNRLRSLTGTMGSNSYILLGDFNNQWAVKLKISSIPRYLLYDANGRLVNMDAPRPSEAALLNQLDKLLAK